MPPSSSSPLARIGRQLSHWICGLHGHDAEVRLEADRLHLHCNHCGHETPGWAVRGTARGGARSRAGTLAVPASRHAAPQTR